MKDYSDQDLEKAVNHVKGLLQPKMIVRAASFKFKVPKSTVNDTVNQKYHSNKQGRRCKLSQATETLLETLILKLADWGFALNKLGIIAIVRQYLKDTNQSHLFKNGIPSDD